MTESATISADQFITFLKQPGAMSAFIQAAGQVDVSSLSACEQKKLAEALRDFAGSNKNGPMLIMGLPGPLQALLSFSGITMPGQDRLAYLRATPELVVCHLASHNDQKVWDNYDFSRFEKKHWKELLTTGCFTKIPKKCEPVLSNKNGNGFTNSELVEIAVKRPLVIPWIKPTETSFTDLLKLYLTGNANDLWQKYDFLSLGKAEWSMLLENTEIDIPAVFFDVAKNGLFSIDELCAIAKKNEKIWPFIPVDKIEPKKVVELLLNSPDSYCLYRYDFGRLDGKLWADWLCKSKKTIPGLYLQKLRTAKGLDTNCVDRILRSKPQYYTDLPLELASRDLIVELLLSGKAEGLWNTYQFSLFSDDNWFKLLEDSEHPVPEEGKIFLSNQSGRIDINRLNALLAKRGELADFINPCDIEPVLAVEILCKFPESAFWTQYDFSRFTDKDVRSLVGIAARRKTWPGEIYDKFDALSDEDITTLAKKRIFNVIELLSIQRIRKSGIEFFDPLCSLMSQDAGAVEAVLKKLSGDAKLPWIGFERDCQVALMKAVPESRKYFDWQKLDLRILDDLIKTHSEFRSELCFCRKFPLFVWKHKRLFKFLILLGLAFSCYVIAGKIKQALHDRVINRQNAIVENIRQLDDQEAYEQLDKYLKDIASGSDSSLLKSDRTADARLNLEKWKTRRQEIRENLYSLEAIADNGWTDNDLPRAETVLSNLGGNKYLLPEEIQIVKQHEETYISKRKAFERRRKINEISSRIDEIKETTVNSADTAAVINNIKILGDLSKDEILDDNTKSKVINAQSELQSHLCSLFEREFKFKQINSELLSSISDLEKAISEIKSLTNNTCEYMTQEVISKYNALMSDLTGKLALAKINDVFQRFDEVKQKSLLLTNAADVFKCLSELDEISKQNENLKELEVGYNKARSEISAHLKSLLEQEFITLQKRSEKLTSLTEIENFKAEIRPLINSQYLPTDIKVKYNDILAKLSNKATQFRKDELSRQMIAIKDQCGNAGKASEAFEFITKLDLISKDKAIDADLENLYTASRNDMFKQLEALLTLEFTENQKHYESLKSIDEIKNAESEIQILLKKPYMNEEVTNKYNNLLTILKGKITILENDAIKKNIIEIRKSVDEILKDLKGNNEQAYRQALLKFNSLSTMPDLRTYKAEYGTEYEKLSKEIEYVNSGIASADKLISESHLLERDVMCFRLLDGIPDTITVWLNSCSEWKKEFATKVKWKSADIDDAYSKVYKFNADALDRLSLVGKANAASNYSELYKSMQMLTKKYSGSLECTRIDPSKILNEEQVKAAISSARKASGEISFDFAGVIMINPKNIDNVIPLIRKDIEIQSPIYSVSLYHNQFTKESSPELRKMFERTPGGGFRKVAGVDYDKCQGIGLFVCNDSSFIDSASWIPGKKNLQHPHWIAAKKYGEWQIEPGYVKKKIFGETLGEVVWKSNKYYLGNEYRTSEMQGCWEKKEHCPYCHNSGDASIGQIYWICNICEGKGTICRKIKCEPCKHCKRRGYILSEPFTCPSCNGQPKRYKYRTVDCAYCDGRGYYWKTIISKNEMEEIVRRIIKNGED